MAEPFIGQIIQFAGNFQIRGYAFCNGQLLSIAQNTALFSILGTTYGGNGQTTFGLPDLRSRMSVHFGQGAGLSNISLGELGGTESVTMNANQMPAHTHTSTLGASTAKATLQTPAAGTVLARTKDGAAPGPALPLIYLPSGTATNVNLGGLNVAATGGGQPLGIRNPYLGLNYLIALQGIFPSRN